MEINKPDKGVFRGFGPLQTEQHHNRKYFPLIRNVHQFQYTHHHPNSYATSFQRFFSTAKNAHAPERAKKNTNQSSFQLGTDNSNYFNSLTKTDYRRFDGARPPKQIRQKEEGVVLGEGKAPDHFVTTTMERFGKGEGREHCNVTFKNRNLTRFNPITGQSKNLCFGFEDFEMGRNNNYKANNHTVVPRRECSFDIISGRKLTYK